MGSLSAGALLHDVGKDAPLSPPCARSVRRTHSSVPIGRSSTLRTRCWQSMTGTRRPQAARRTAPWPTPWTWPASLCWRWARRNKMAAAAISGIIPRDFPKSPCFPVSLVIHYITTTEHYGRCAGERKQNPAAEWGESPREKVAVMPAATG